MQVLMIKGKEAEAVAAPCLANQILVGLKLSLADRYGCRRTS